MAARPGQGAESIIFVRHGEKPAAGLGQLSCKGLNRALALPKALATKFPTPAAIFAPDPAERKKDHGVAYDYVRPLATIEPTAIALGMPVDTTFGVSSLASLRKRLAQPRYRNAALLVAWEHKQIVTLARDLIARNGGDPRTVPAWRDDNRIPASSDALERNRPMTAQQIVLRISAMAGSIARFAASRQPTGVVKSHAILGGLQHQYVRI